MTDSKPIRKLDPLEVSIRDIARQTEKLRERVEQHRLTANAEGMLVLQRIVDRYDDILDDAALLQTNLATARRRRNNAKN